MRKDALAMLTRPDLAPGQASAHQSGAQAGWGSSRSFLLGSSRLVGEAWSSSSQETAPQCSSEKSLDLLPGVSLGDVASNIHGACAPVSHISHFVGHNYPVVTGRDYLDLEAWRGFGIFRGHPAEEE